MFVMNLTDTKLEYSTNGVVIKLFPNTVTEVEDSLVTAGQLVACYGSRIDIITEDRVKKIKEEQEIVNTSVTENKGEKDSDVKVAEEEYKAALAEAEKYFEDIAEDNDSDKHLKLAIEEKLKADYEKEGKVWETVDLMEEIEKVFPEEKAKLEEEAKKLEEANANKKDDSEELDPNNIAKGLADKAKEVIEKDNVKEDKDTKAKLTSKAKSTKENKKANK